MNKGRKIRRGVLRGVFFLAVLAALFYAAAKFPLILTEINYGREVNTWAAEFNLPPSYLKALIVLESGGRKNIRPRFEQNVFDKLKELRRGRLKKFENLRPKTIHDASDDALKNLASSWGPFQLMGYKCVLLGINVQDIRGTNAVFWGIKWIDMTYGDLLRQKQFDHAFHIHNTGRPFPEFGSSQTHNPHYVRRGLRHMRFFRRFRLWPE